ncbi:metallo-beta-lactamase superfamily protein [Xylogone sp. PMI_703]|nr:metallo-beta-lactamase superfamily protein [Xylogone sp. PMI_703]
MLTTLTTLFTLVVAVAEAHSSHSHGCNCSAPIAPPATQLISNGIRALGGQSALANLSGVIYDSGGIYRSATLMQNYKLLESDRYITIAGNQNVSFSFSDGVLRQRIDRNFQRSDYWYFSQPTAAPAKFSLVMQSGDDGYACFIEGNNNVFISPDQTSGYTAGVLADYLLLQAQKLSPKLLLDIQSHNATSRIVTLESGVKLPAVYDQTLGIAVIFDTATNLPYIIRSFENHAIFGLSTSDLELSNYTTVNGIQFPQKFSTIYNGKAVLEETTLTQITTNPLYSSTFFDGLPETESTTPKEMPAPVPGYSHAEIGEYYMNTIWSGEYAGTLENISVTHPVADLPGLHLISFLDAPNLEQAVLEFDDGVLVMESPPHQTDLVIRWVNETLKKPITHLWPSHHHHDHNYGASEYVKLGAKLIVPEVSASYWKQIPGAKLVTFNDKKPYIHRDSSMQARFLWSPEAAHAVDWTYSIVSKACPSANNSIVAYVADAWSTSLPIDDKLARTWVDQAVGDGLSKNALVIPAHGSPAPFTQLIDFLGYQYPNITTTDWKAGGRLCAGRY